MRTKLLRAGLTAAAAVSAVAIAVRILFGPLQFPVSIHSPLNIESFFGIAGLLLVLLAAHRGRKDAGVSQRSIGRDAAAMLSVAILTIAVLAWTTRFYFLSDDFVLLRHAANTFTNMHAVFAQPGGDGSYRPVMYLSLVLSRWWAGEDPVLWHSLGLAIHAANAALVYLLAVKLAYSRLSAWFAAALFALHGSRPEPVVWMAGRPDLLAGFFTLLALLCFVAAQGRPGPRRILLLAISVACMTLGLLSKESAYALPLLLLLVPGSLSRRTVWTLLPFFAVAGALFVYRWMLFGGIGGYLDASGRPQILDLGIIPVLKILTLRVWAILFFPINWSFAPGLALGLITVIYLGGLLWVFRGRVAARRLVLPLGFVLLGALPAIALLLIGADLQKARLLYLPSAGFCLLLAVLCDAMPARARLAIIAAVLAFHLSALLHNLSAWQDASERARQACSTAALCSKQQHSGVTVSGLPGSLNGVYFFANGFPECVSMMADSPAPLSTGGHAACEFTWDAATASLRR